VHEFSLATDVQAIAVQAARDGGVSCIHEVRLEVGRLAGVSIDALTFAWEMLRSGDPLTAGAELRIDVTEGEAECEACGYKGLAQDYLHLCPSCGALALRITGGGQFLVTGLSGE